MKFSKDEIELCKKIAEKHRKEIEYGDWYWSTAHNKILLAIDGGFKASEQEFPGVFKIWQISDCLEFLKEKCNRSVSLNHPEEYMKEEWFLWFDYEYTSEKGGGGKTPLEACLKVVLAIVEES